MLTPRPESRIELSLSALRRNLRFVRDLAGRPVEEYAVIKGNAYGHGIESFVPMLEQCGVTRLATSSAHEAYRARQAYPGAVEIMVMYSITDDELAWAIEHGISFWVYTQPKLAHALRLAERIGRPARIHLELETGLHRHGLQGVELDGAVDLLLQSPDTFELEGLCTHFAGAESVANDVRVHAQRERLQQLVLALGQRGIRPQRVHAACSAAMLRFPETIADAIRPGIALYGFWPSRETEMSWLLQHSDPEQAKPPANPLRRVMRWSSDLLAVNDVPAGSFVGYGTSYQAQRDSRIATVPVGYAHGYPRALSNRGHMLVRGRRAPVVGLVNMNLCMLDVTDIPGAQTGDEAVIIGRQGRRAISVASFAEMTQDLNYEVLLRLAADIPRTVTR